MRLWDDMEKLEALKRSLDRTIWITLAIWIVVGVAWLVLQYFIRKAT